MRLIRIFIFALFLTASGFTAQAVQAATFPVTGEVNVETALHMRMAPTLEAESIDRLADGTSLHVLSEQAGWYKVTHNNKIGYVKSDYVTLSTSSLSPSDNKKPTVVIDAGHGGIDQGASGTEQNTEKDMTLALSNLVAEKLEQKEQIHVVKTRDEALDQQLTNEKRKQELSEKTRIANENNAELFVSIHFNSGPSSANGTETYHYESEQSKTLSKTIHKHVVKATGFKDRGMDSRNLYVLKNTDMPAVLLEIGFISNSYENKAMQTPAFQERVAQAIADGIEEYCKAQ